MSYRATRLAEPLARRKSETFRRGKRLHSKTRGLFLHLGNALGAEKADMRIINLETAVTQSNDMEDKAVNYRMHPDIFPASPRRILIVVPLRTITFWIGDTGALPRGLLSNCRDLASPNF